MVIDNIIVSGRNMDVGEALTEHVQNRMVILSERYFGKIVSTRVVFTKTAKGYFECHITAIIGHNLHYDANAVNFNVYSCFTKAYDHLAKQMRRQKRFLHDDKPNGHAKEHVLNELSTPEFINSGITHLDIEGKDLGILDGDNPSAAIQRFYK